MVQYAPMAKNDIIETDECLSFRAELNDAELREYQHIRAQLAQDGFLVAPLAEKVERDLCDPHSQRRQRTVLLLL